jgi:hypothetical protein
MPQKARKTSLGNVYTWEDPQGELPDEVEVVSSTELSLVGVASGKTIRTFSWTSIVSSKGTPASNSEDYDIFMFEIRDQGIYEFECEDCKVFEDAFEKGRASGMKTVSPGVHIRRIVRPPAFEPQSSKPAKECDQCRSTDEVQEDRLCHGTFYCAACMEEFYGTPKPEEEEPEVEESSSDEESSAAESSADEGLEMVEKEPGALKNMSEEQHMTCMKSGVKMSIRHMQETNNVKPPCPTKKVVSLRDMNDMNESRCNVETAKGDAPPPAAKPATEPVAEPAAKPAADRMASTKQFRQMSAKLSQHLHLFVSQPSAQRLPVLFPGMKADASLFPQHEFHPSVMAEQALPQKVVVHSLTHHKGKDTVAEIEMIFPEGSAAMRVTTLQQRVVSRDYNDFKILKDAIHADKVSYHGKLRTAIKMPKLRKAKQEVCECACECVTKNCMFRCSRRRWKHS